MSVDFKRVTVCLTSKECELIVDREEKSNWLPFPVYVCCTRPDASSQHLSYETGYGTTAHAAPGLILSGSTGGDENCR